MWWGRQRYGAVTFQARPGSRNKWEVEDRVLPTADAADKVLSTAWLDADFTLLQGTYDRRNPRGFLEGAYGRDTEGGIKLEHRTAEYVNRTKPPGSEPAIATLSAWLLRCRHLDPGDTPWREVDFDPDPPTGDPIRATATLSHHGSGRWRTGKRVREATIWSLTRGRRTYRLAFDPKTKDFLGLVVVGMSVSISPKGTGPAGLAAPFDERLAAPVERAARRAASVRAALPLPEQPLSVEALLTLDEAVIGSVLVEARPASHNGAPAWHVTEAIERRGGAAVVRSESTLLLARDLTVLRGENLHRSPSGWDRFTFEQVDGGMAIAQTSSYADPRSAVVPLRPRPIQGVAALLLFLRQAPDKPAQYVLPGFDPRLAGVPKAGSGALVSNAADVKLTVGRAARQWQWRVRVEANRGRHYDLWVARDTRALRGSKAGCPAPAGRSKVTGHRPTGSRRPRTTH